jgi:iron complex outermembrane receptor protein
MFKSFKSKFALLSLTLALFSIDTVAQGLLEEIVVTARKRDESYQDVPVSETAFTEADIQSAGIETPADYILRTPNITLVETQNQGTSFITIRGISQARNSEPSAAVLIDGVLMANPSQFNQELFDIQQIEVLRGSQGALYGRNAIGGVITVSTKDPTDEFEGRITVGGDSGPGYKVVGSVSGPIMEDLKYRATISYKDTDGYIYNPVLDEEADPYRDISGRVKFLWQPLENLTADFRVSVSKVDTQALYFNIAAEADDTSLPVQVNNAGENERDMYNVSLKLDYDSEYGTFTSVTSYDDLEELLTGDQYDFLPRAQSFANWFADSGFSPFFAFLKLANGGQVIDLSQTQFLDTSSWSQEFRFTSPSDNRLRWIAGGYFIFTDRYISTGNQIDRGNGVFPVYRTPRSSIFDAFPWTDPSPQLSLLEDAQDNFAWAVFGSVSYDFTDRIEGTVALRYDEDTRENTTLTKPLYDPTDLDGPGGNPGLTTLGEVRKHTWDDLQPKFTVRWLATDNVTVYGDYSRGFRSGGFNQSGVGAAVPTPGIDDLFDQETANTYEGGIKIQAMEKRLNLSFSAFHTDAEGSYFFFFDPTTSTQNLGNLDEVTYTGLEFEAVALVTEGLQLNASVGVTDSEIDAAEDPTQVGNEAPLVSDYTLNIGGEYRRPLASFNGINAFIRLDYMRTGDTYWEPNNISVRSPVDLVDLRAGIESPDNWSLTFWSRNLLDEDYNAEFSPGPAPGSHFLFKGAPMRWGVDFTKRF